ncbi:hypothetical protein C3R19_27475, partial [Blautia producta]
MIIPPAEAAGQSGTAEKQHISVRMDSNIAAHPLKKAEMCRCFCGFYRKSAVYGKKCKLFLTKRKKY